MARMKDVRDQARKLMQGFCRVCPVCDGRACAGEIPGVGGTGTGRAFMNNVQALADVRLAMRTIHGVTQPDLSVDVLGQSLSLPVLAAPIAGVAWHLSKQVAEPDYLRAVLEGCLSRGAMGTVGDGPTGNVPSLEDEAIRGLVAELGGRAIPFIKPWEGGELGRKLKLAQDAGCTVVGMDIDAAGLLTLRRIGQPVSPKTVDQLAEIIASTSMRFVLKGVMCPEDALLAIQAGAHGIVVSNHGGRVLDHTPGTAEVLPAVARAVGGKAAVLVDGGVRTGSDVLKMLALGADAVLIGRPVSIAAVGGGAEGVAAYLDRVALELTQAMILTGTARASDVPASVIHKQETAA